MPNEHAPLVLRDDTLISWKANAMNMASVPIQYGYGCLDGMLNTLKIVGDAVYLSAVDAGAHFARHIYNSARAVLYREDVGSLEDAVRAGRAYDFNYPVSLETRAGPVDLRAYLALYQKLMFVNMDYGFASGNYVRPFYAACEERLDGVDSDFAINGRVYKKTLSAMMQYWPGILGPRHPDFPGLNVLVCQNSRCPAPGTSLTEFKSSSTYAPTRGPAVEEKNRFNDRFGSTLTAHDILLYDHLMQSFREASGSNMFFVDGSGHIYTPKLDGSIFPGLTRDFVLRLINSEAGKTLGLSLHECDLDDSIPGRFSINGELFFTGSALGVIPAKRLIVPRTKTPRTLDDYRVFEFKTGPGTYAAAIQDCYKCFSVGDGFEVTSPRGTTQMRDFESCPLLFEVPPELRAKAKERFLRVEGTMRELSVPTDQTLTSGMVRALPARENRIMTVNEYRRTLAR